MTDDALLDTFGSAPIGEYRRRPTEEDRARRGYDAWARFLARFVDVLILVTPGAVLFYQLLVIVAAGLGHPGAFKGLAPIDATVLGAALALLASLVLEALCLSVFGATPGKALMGVQVRDRSGRKIGFGTALGRWLQVFVIGRGLGIPVVSLIALWIAYNKLRETGRTYWDTALNLKVTRSTLPFWRWGLAVLGWGLLIAINLYAALQSRGLI